MMEHSDQQREREYLLRVAQEYRDKGYDVVVHPQGDALPLFLTGFEPDLIARRDNDAVVVVVTSRPAMAASPYLSQLARVIEGQRGWRFELIVTSGESSSYWEKAQGSFEEQEIAANLADACELAIVHAGPALLYAWSQAEATLRLLAEREGLTLRAYDPRSLLKQLATEGIISQEAYNELIEAFKLRSAVAHGYKAGQLSPELVNRLIATIEKLLRSLQPV